MLVLRTGETIPLPRASKREIADRIFDEVLKLRLAPACRPMDADQLRQYLEFYQDLGVKTLYRRGPRAGASAAHASQNQAADVVDPL